jgi:hypothetical protein
MDSKEVVMKKLMVLLLSAGFLHVQAATLSFEGPADIPAFVQELKEESSKRGAALRYGPGMPPAYWTESCELIEFKPGDALVSKPVKLLSQKVDEICRPWAGECHTVIAEEVKRSVRIRIEGRGSLSGQEKEVFRLCLKDWTLRASVVKAERSYELKVPDMSEGGEKTVVARLGK